MAPITSTLISSGTKKKEPRYVFLREAKISHSHKMWIKVSSSVPRFLQLGLLYHPTICIRLLKLLCPVSRPTTNLDCILLQDNTQDPVARSGTEITSRACLYVLLEPRHNARCCFSIYLFIFLHIFCLETLNKGSGPTNC